MGAAMGKKNDLRVQKTHEAIMNAFNAMICEMDASKITVKALTERAKVHRQTFYLHYNSLEDLYEEIMKETLAKFAAVGSSMSPPWKSMRSAYSAAPVIISTEDGCCFPGSARASAGTTLTSSGLRTCRR